MAYDRDMGTRDSRYSAAGAYARAREAGRAMSTTTARGFKVERVQDGTADSGERVTITRLYDGQSVTVDGVEDAAYVVAYTCGDGDDDWTGATRIALLFAGDAMEAALEAGWQGMYDANVNEDVHGTGYDMVATARALEATR